MTTGRALGLMTVVAALAACGPEHGPGTRTPSGSASASSGVEGGVEGARPKQVDPAVVPTVTGVDLENGARFVGATHAGASISEVRVVVRTGSADDGDQPGTARAVGRAVRTAYDALAKSDGRAATDIALRVSPNASVFAFRVAPDGVGPTLKALGAAFAKAALDAADVRAAVKLLVEETKAERADLTTLGARFVQRDLFVAPIGRHPYAVTVPSPEELGRVDPKAASAFFVTHYVASNVSVVAITGASAADVRPIVEQSLAGLRKGDGRAADVDNAEGRARPWKVMIVDAPKQDPVLVTFGKFGPTAEQGTDTKTRLFGAVLADRLGRAGVAKLTLDVVPLRRAPVIALFRAELPASAAPDGIKKIHDALDGWSAPSADELVAARNVVTGELLRTIDPPSALADALARIAAVDQAENALERRGVESGLAEAADVGVTGSAILGHDGILVVVGDAAKLAPALTAFGEVDVLDPNADFARVRSVRP